MPHSIRITKNQKKVMVNNGCRKCIILAMCNEFALCWSTFCGSWIIKITIPANGGYHFLRSMCMYAVITWFVLYNISSNLAIGLFIIHIYKTYSITSGVSIVLPTFSCCRLTFAELGSTCCITTEI